MNPLPGGDDLLLPLNMTKADSVEDSSESPAADSNDNDSSLEQPDDTSNERDVVAVAWVADVRRRLEARITNDVRQGGAKALRQGGRLGLSEWGEGQQMDWRHAGEEMLGPLIAVGGPVDLALLGDWVASCYQAAVRELVNGN
jgi:hypothetical protein